MEHGWSKDCGQVMEGHLVLTLQLGNPAIYINEYASLMMFAEEFERFAVRKYTNFAQIKYLKEAKGKCRHSCIALSLYLLLLR